MNVLYRWINLFSSSYSQNSLASSLRWSLTTVPLLRSIELSGSTTKEFEAEEIHLCCTGSSLLLEITSTLEATRKEE